MFRSDDGVGQPEPNMCFLSLGLNSFLVINTPCFKKRSHQSFGNCQILTDFQNPSTAEKRMKFPTKPRNIFHHTWSMFSHYLGKFKFNSTVFQKLGDFFLEHSAEGTCPAGIFSLLPCSFSVRWAWSMWSGWYEMKNCVSKQSQSIGFQTIF